MASAPRTELGPRPATGGRHDLVVLANRLPVDHTVDAEGRPCWRRSPGGLVTALHPIMKQRAGAWIGWSGRPGPAPAAFVDDDIHLHPVALTGDEVEGYYEGQSNATIWPLYHDAVEQPTFDRAWQDHYREVNRRFAEAGARVAAPGALVWVHDYHLQLVPGMLRALRPDLRIGFFLHIPFPPVELFCQMPMREEILRGLLGADLIGFQHAQGARNLAMLAADLLGAKSNDQGIRYEGRDVGVDPFPISIDVAEQQRLGLDPAVRSRAAQIRRELGAPRTVILAVDRLDYTKGIEGRLQAYRELLAERRLDPADTAMVQVAVPTRQGIDQYQALRQRVECEVSRINGEHADIGRLPVHYLHQSFDRAELAALYLAADVMAVTPLRDGMNLVAKEYVATRTDGTGALVLSEFAGAAAELREAWLVNPHDVDAVKDAFAGAAFAGADEQGRRMASMRSYLRGHDVDAWATGFLDRLGQDAAGYDTRTSRTPESRAVSKSAASSTRPSAPITSRRLGALAQAAPAACRTASRLHSCTPTSSSPSSTSHIS
ncbi:trehalose-6-phosphate synthase [Catellatospora sp. TT07R-123]|uniref:alpha,alpha-trehalose-phosphate synthase (UDP-forming) n=1 Tax=Catellatospora sp. TT07R-123 TaxID=2733863 RepID=UPI001B2E000A|nr:trehalose-6-phosphate synthase [Catellatospora sp. TT07R-123]GHJ43496.1 trehalose-6-phosphate synthase [Catellatospora sp. TT07R-123]